ncbi:NYN domain-containing protein [Acetilactobacillus jinshanensis]|uniref:NYN domain-containing protein n=1 Tax=Acetilactobacillus jinshanensis TaxID=1720083 RepID=A0A4P6ZNV1_9LACO|nr:NYN domain-containing protein [Acetilactobacillus jinshanensis]QBP18850.1 NYN domain-containing protein [Acetilactobacillus jinshanensis]URL61717.1 NYN domain-containing protein [uncultured bacterium]
MKKTILVIDAYNVIGQWPHLNRLKLANRLGDARDELLRELSDYKKYRNIPMIVVFDAMYVPGLSQKDKRYNLDVVWTRKDETADSYIEALVRKKQSRFVQIVVVTSDDAEQWTVFSAGALRMPDSELWDRIKQTRYEVNRQVHNYQNQDMVRKVPWNKKQLSELSKLRDRLSRYSHPHH